MVIWGGKICLSPQVTALIHILQVKPLFFCRNQTPWMDGCHILWWYGHWRDPSLWFLWWEAQSHQWFRISPRMHEEKTRKSPNKSHSWPQWQTAWFNSVDVEPDIGYGRWRDRSEHQRRNHKYNSIEWLRLHPNEGLPELQLRHLLHLLNSCHCATIQLFSQ